jgi:uncharacterized protein YsxB (DUF464 family)
MSSGSSSASRSIALWARTHAAKICASISTLFTTAVNALEEQLSWKDFYMVTGNESNFCEVWTPEGITDKERETANVILKTIIRGILDVEESVREEYGSDYLQVTTKTK